MLKISRNSLHYKIYDKMHLTVYGHHSYYNPNTICGYVLDYIAVIFVFMCAILSIVLFAIGFFAISYYIATTYTLLLPLVSPGILFLYVLRFKIKDVWKWFKNKFKILKEKICVPVEYE